MSLDHSYFLLRDFEYAQVLYDLAFLLEIKAFVLHKDSPKYRVLSLKKAAQGIDSYSNNIARWLRDEIKDSDLAYLPSARIKNYLKSIDVTGTVPELMELQNKKGYSRCLHLRSIRGLGIVRIAESVAHSSPSSQWLDSAASSTGLSQVALIACYNGEMAHSWQTPHVIPPLLRLLKVVEEISGVTLHYSITGIESVFEPLTGDVGVKIDIDSTISIQKIIRKALKSQKMFLDLYSKTMSVTYLKHRMGWSVSLSSGLDSTKTYSIEQIAYSLDPLTRTAPRLLKGDLHAHSAWSDGVSSIASMAAAGAAYGFAYIAITDHSRSSKLQGGLTPSSWLHQRGSIARLRAPIAVLHGIEVDILKSGELDLPHNVLNAADIVIASVHSGWATNEGENTHRLIAAIESGHIDILGHPTATIIGKPGKPAYFRPPIRADWPRIFTHCAKWKVALEFNCFPSRFDLPPGAIRQAQEAGCWISFGSDAHSTSHLQHLFFGERVIEESDYSQFLNLLPFEELIKWLHDARESRKTLKKSTTQTQPELDFAITPVEEEITISATVNMPRGIPDGSRVIGLDLTASAKKATGVALLDGKHVQTYLIETDDELLAFIREQRPRIVSIDSPLGLPGGGKEIKESAGIVRLAESDLSSIGIPAYPALIDSMKPLTLRGIGLKHRIESLDPAPIVIESYPGAAQDVLSLPRKQRSLELLREGLRGIGLSGSGLDLGSHDEIDAITSALVGRFYENASYVPMGTPSESELIVPAIGPLSFDSPIIICLAGVTGAGKSTVARCLSVYYGLRWLKTRDIIREMLIEDSSAIPSERMFDRVVDHQNITEDDLREFGGLILHKYKQKPLRRKLTAIIAGADESIVIDSVRAYTDIDWSAVRKTHPYIWLIECDEKTIRSRLINRAKHGVKKPTTSSPVDAGVADLYPKAARIIRNDGSLETLRWTVDDMLFSHVAVNGREW